MPDTEKDIGIIIEERPVLENRHLKVIERKFKPAGTQETRSQLIWDRRGKIFVVILAVTENGEVILVEEPKYGIFKRILALPAGGVDPGESVWNAAERELEEETGYTSDAWKILRGPIIDFADKIDGGEHFFLLGENARRVGLPAESGCVPRLIKKREIASLIEGGHPKLEVNLAVSLACLSCWHVKSYF